MTRFALASALALAVSLPPSVMAQLPAAKPATPPTTAKSKFATPVKGMATIEVLQAPSKFAGKEILTVFKIKNTSAGPIAMLKIDEYWYDQGGKMVSSDTQRWRQPFGPGEIIEMTTRSPATPGASRSQAQFSHANGGIKPTRVKQIK